MMQKNWKMTETLACGYSSESTQRELSSEYHHDRVYMVFKNLCFLVLWTKIGSALEVLKTLVIGWQLDLVKHCFELTLFAYSLFVFWNTVLKLSNQETHNWYRETLLQTYACNILVICIVKHCLKPTQAADSLLDSLLELRSIVISLHNNCETLLYI